MSSWRTAPIGGVLLPLVSAGVRLGCLICVDTDGHLEKIPPQTWELVERILAKQLFVEASHQDKPFETAEDILMHLLDGWFLPPRTPATGVRHLTWRISTR